MAQVSEPVANIDFAPTILRLADARPCDAKGRCRVMDGSRLLPLLRGRAPRGPPNRPLGVELQLTNANPSTAVCRYAGVRLPGVIFVRHREVADRPSETCVKDRELERYDLANDPYQLRNLCFGGRSCPTDRLQTRLKRLLTRLHNCSGIQGRDPRPSQGYYCG